MRLSLLAFTAVVVLMLLHKPAISFPTSIPYQWQCTVSASFSTLNYSLVYEEYAALGSYGAPTSWFWFSMFQTIGRYGNRDTAEFTQLTGDGIATDPFYVNPYYARYSIASTATAEVCYGFTAKQASYLAYMHSRAIWDALAWSAINWTTAGSVQITERQVQGEMWTTDTLLILTQDGSVCLANTSCWVNGSTPFYTSAASRLSAPAYHFQELADMNWVVDTAVWQTNITNINAYVRPYALPDQFPFANWTNSDIPVRVTVSGMRRNTATGMVSPFSSVFDWSNYQPLTSSLTTYSGCPSNFSNPTAAPYILPLPTTATNLVPAAMGSAMPLTDFTATFMMVLEGSFSDTGNANSTLAARAGAATSFFTNTLGVPNSFAMSWLYSTADATNNYGRSSEVIEAWDYTANTFRNFVYFYENLTQSTDVGGFSSSNWAEPSSPGPGYTYEVNGVGNGSAICISGNTTSCWTCGLSVINATNQNPLRVLHGGALWKLMSNPGGTAFTATKTGTATLRNVAVDVYSGVINIVASSGWSFSFVANVYLYQTGWQFPGRQALNGSGVDPAFAQTPLRLTAVGTAYPPYFATGYSSFTFTDVFDIFDISPVVIDYNFAFDSNLGIYNCPFMPSPAPVAAPPSVPFPTASLPYQWSATITQTFTTLNYTLAYEEYIALDPQGGQTFFWYDMFQTIGRYTSRYVSEFTQLSGCATNSVCSTAPYNAIPYKPYFQHWDTNSGTCTNYPVTTNAQYLAYMHSRAIWTTLGDFPYLAWTYNGLGQMADRAYVASSWTTTTVLILTADGSVCLVSGACTPNNGSAFFGTPAQGVLTPPLWPLQELVDMNFAVDPNAYQSNITQITVYTLTGSTAYSLLAQWRSNVVLPVRVEVWGQRQNVSSGSSVVQSFHNVFDWSNVQPLWDNIPTAGGCTQASTPWTAPLPTYPSPVPPQTAVVGSALPTTAFASNSFTTVLDWNTSSANTYQFVSPGQPLGMTWWYQKTDATNPLGGPSEAVQLWSIARQALLWWTYYYTSTAELLGYRYDVQSYTNTSNSACGDGQCFNCTLDPVVSQAQSNPLSFVRGGVLYTLLTSAPTLATSLTASGSSLVRGVMADKYTGTVGTNGVTVYLYPAGWQFPGRHLNGSVDVSAARNAMRVTVTGSTGLVTDVFDLFDFYPQMQTLEGNALVPSSGSAVFGCPVMPTIAPGAPSASSSPAPASVSSTTSSSIAYSSSSIGLSSVSKTAASSTTAATSSSTIASTGALATSSAITSSMGLSAAGLSSSSTGGASFSSSSNHLALGLGLGLGLGGGLCLLCGLFAACCLYRRDGQVKKDPPSTAGYDEQHDSTAGEPSEHEQTEVELA